MNQSNPDKPGSPGGPGGTLEEQRLGEWLVRNLLVDKAELELATARPGDPMGADALLQRLRLRGLITNHQARRLGESLDSLLGQGIPGYELIDRIGQGSTAQVFKARHLGTDRLVALKVMPGRAGGPSSEVQKFLALARAWARVRHPRIVQVLDAGERPFPFCALEYLPVPSMERDPRVIKRSTPFSERDLARVGLQVSEALCCLHGKGVVHRDIKPANLFLLEDGSILVGDLGLALWNKVDPHQARERGLALGSPYYMPPEQIANDAPLDGRADLYALGITLFQLATGKVPYSGDNPDQVYQHHFETPVPRLNQGRPDLSAAFCETVSNLMAKDARHRPASAEVVVELFGRIEARARLEGGAKAGR